MSPLNGAVPVVQMYNIAGLVSHDLDLDVTRLLDEPLDEDGAVAEGLDSLCECNVNNDSWS